MYEIHYDNVSHFGLHAYDIILIGRVDPFFCCLSYFILDLPLCGLSFTPGSDGLNVSHDTVYRGCFATVGCWALRGVVSWLVTFETGNGGRVAGVSSLCVWERLWLVPRLVCWWVGPRRVGVARVILRRIPSAVVVIPSIVAWASVAVPPIVA